MTGTLRISSRLMGSFGWSGVSVRSQASGRNKAWVSRKMENLRMGFGLMYSLRLPRFGSPILKFIAAVDVRCFFCLAENPVDVGSGFVALCRI